MCECCTEDKGVYDFSNQCCKVRYLIKEPRLDVRRALMDKWKKELGTEAFNNLVSEVKEKWESRRKWRESIKQNLDIGA